MGWLRRLPLDPFLLMLFGAIGLALLLPARGDAALWLSWAAKLAIGLLFFMHGVRLPAESLRAGLTNWPVQLLIFALTFLYFPLIGWVAAMLDPGLLNERLWMGVLFLCVLPSTVQSSIALTALAGGNLAAAVCAATASNILAVAITPLLASVMIGAAGENGDTLAQTGKVVVQILLPFAAGQLLRRWLWPHLSPYARFIGLGDRGVILLAVYSSFSAAIVARVWAGVPAQQFLLLAGVVLALLLLGLAGSLALSAWLGLARDDRIAVVLCGGQKSLVSGVPFANVLFPAATSGLLMLPLILFHQLQLLLYTAMARRYAKQAPPPG
ncbi:MAG: bile acid:sodium symporter [Sphingomonadales bacterium]